MTEEQSWQIGHLMSRSDRLSGQIETIWSALERWRKESEHDQAVVRALLALIVLLVVVQGVAMVWIVERTQTNTDARLQALETRVEELERVAW